MPSEAGNRLYGFTLPTAFFVLGLALYTFLTLSPTLSNSPSDYFQGVAQPTAHRPTDATSDAVNDAVNDAISDAVESTSTAGTSTASTSTTSAVPAPSIIIPDKPYYLKDLTDYKLPQLNFDELNKYPPHNYAGPGNPAFATFFMTRNGSLYDPIFISAQQLVFRILWAQEQKSVKYPVVVFVLPFVPELQRQYFRAAGAMVREVEERAFTATQATLGRYQDQFAKLDMWNQMDFSHILYMDADALSWSNVDPAFEFEDQRCNETLLAPEDLARKDEICDYQFGAWVNVDDGEINAGVMLLKPNLAMYDRLVREFVAVNGHIGGTNEQGFLNTTFSEAGPFPRRVLSDKWNGGHKEGSEFYILHGKPWVMNDGDIAWVGANFKQMWADLLKLYKSSAFMQLRMADRDRAMANKVIVPSEKPGQR